MYRIQDVGHNIDKSYIKYTEEL